MTTKLRNSSMGFLVGWLLLCTLLSVEAQSQERNQRMSFLSSSWVTASEAQDMFYSADLTKQISIQMDNQTLEEGLRDIADRTGLKLTYRGDIMVDKQVTIHETKMSVSEALALMLEDTGLDYKISQLGYLLILPIEETTSVEVFQETITGQVFDAQTGEALPGVNIQIQGTSTGTSTNVDGEYELTVQDLNVILTFSYIGYTSAVVPLNGRNSVDVQLEPSEIGLDQVVVVGYGTQERSDLTGSIAQVSVAEDIEGQAVSNLNQALQGRIPGVKFTSTSGDPGAQVNVRIRGLNTFGNSGPLYVVDGLPMDQSQINSINPNDIETVSVLKDASAAAIYGSRAANGVIIINTKSGQEGLQVTYNGYAGVQTVPSSNFIPLLNSQQYMDQVNEAHVNGNYYPLQPAFNDPQLVATNLQTNTDWQAAAISSAPMSDHTLTVSSGGPNHSYSVSGNYLNQESVLAFRDMQRYQVRIKSQFNIGRLTLGESVILSRREGLNLGYANNLDLAYMFGAAPTMGVYCPENDSGFCGPTRPTTGVNNRDNILGRRGMKPDNTYRNRMIGSAFAVYEIIDGLEFKLNAGLQHGQDRRHYYNPIFEMGRRGSNNNSLSTSHSEYYDYLLENTLNYEKDIHQNVEMGLLAGYTQQNYTSNYISGSINTFPSNDLRVINAGTGNFSLSGNETESALRSFFGRANFTLFQRYLVTATIRRDGSSRFGAANRYGNFPSFAVGWNIDQERFMENISEISTLKLRASWGILGNQDIGNYNTQTVIGSPSRYYFGADSPAPIAAVTSLGNPLLRWEKTTQSNLGVDVAFLEDKILFTADYWIKDTEGVLVRTPISSLTGFQRGSGPFQNAAELQNKGFEFMAEYREVRGDLRYSFSANLSTTRNEVKSLGRGDAIVNLVENVYYSGVYAITEPGRPMSTFYGHIMDGIFQNQAEIAAHALQPGAEPGDVKFRDINGDGVIDADDRTYIGDPWPDFDFGIAFNGAYRNFDFNMSLYGVVGQQLYNANRAYLETMNGEWNSHAGTVNRWDGEGSSNTMPRAVRGGRNNNTRPSTRFVDNADFLRIQNVQVGYTLPTDVLNRMGIRNIRVYGNVQNLYTFSSYFNYNPDTLGGQGFSDDSMNPLGFGVDTGSVPIPTVFQAGVDINF